MTGLKGSALKEKIASGQPVIGTFVGTADPLMARLFAQLGFDFIIIDTEHHAINNETLQQMLLYFEGTKTCPIVRVPWHEPAWTKWALDFGAEGIMFPNVINAAAAQQAVSNCKYPPDGSRGFFPKNASNFLMDLADYLQDINERILVWTQIEHIQAVENLDQILQVPGIDALYIGPADLSLSMGILGKYDDPRYLETVETIFSKAKRAGVPVAYHLYEDSPEFVHKIRHGVQIYSYGMDWLFAQQAATAYLKNFRELLK